MAKAIIDLNALRHNYQYLKNLSPESKTLAVIKADAYGHGLIQVAQALENTADGLAVARLEEALKLIAEEDAAATKGAGSSKSKGEKKSK